MATSGKDCNQNRVQLLVLGWIRLFIEKKIKDIPIEIKLVCKEFFGSFIDSKIVSIKEETLLLSYVRNQTKQNWNWKLIYRGTEHGFGREDFYDKCKDKGNTVVIVHNEYDQVFGGYTPCKWIKCQSYRSSYSSDDDHAKDLGLTSFLYILRTTFELGPRLFKLKADKKDTAVAYYYNTAFDFGCNDFYLFDKEVWTELPDCCYEWYDTKETVYLGGESDSAKPKEIEIFELY